jgi:hypothetical protein
MSKIGTVRPVPKNCIGSFAGMTVVAFAMRAMDRLDCWRDSLHRLMSVLTPDAELGEGLLRFWVSDGFHISRSLRGDRIFVDVLRCFVPPYKGGPITLFRGELQSRHLLSEYGLSWTSRLEVAEMFAQRRVHLQEGDGVVLQIEAGPEIIICARPAHSGSLKEDEYLVDPRDIGGVEVLETFS